MNPDRDVAPTRVLYVDDDNALARLIQKALGRQGFAVDLASSDGQAIVRALVAPRHAGPA